MSGYIYLIRLHEFVSTNEQTYKVGKTTRQITDRINEYPKNSELYMNIFVPNCHIVETRILQKMKTLFVRRREYGLETFTGPLAAIQIVIMQEITAYLTELTCIPDAKKLLKYVELIRAKPKEDVYDSSLYNITINNDANEQVVNIDDNLIEAEGLEDLKDLNETSQDEETPGTFPTYTKNSRGDFYRHIYNTKPTWYKENSFVAIEIIVNAYNEFFNDSKNASIVSRYIGPVLFVGESRGSNSMKKKLAKFDILKQHFEDL